MNKMMDAMMLSCQKAAALIDRKSLFNLSWKESIQLKMHTGMCTACTNYLKQSKAIDLFLEKNISLADNSGIPHMVNDSLKEKIISKL